MNRPAPRRAALLVLLLPTLGLSTHCSSPPVLRRDWSQYTGPGAQYFLQEEIPFPGVEDPIEPVNRVTSALNYGLTRFVFAPFACTYRAIVPHVVRSRVTKASINSTRVKPRVNMTAPR